MPVWADRRGERLPPRDLLISILGGSCAKCGSITNLQIHHKVPLASGGTNRLENLALLCEECHSGETEKFAKIGRLRAVDRTTGKGENPGIQHERGLPAEVLHEPYWFEKSELFRFDDEAAFAHIWRVTAINENWSPATVQNRHDSLCELQDCPLRGSGVIALMATSRETPKFAQATKEGRLLEPTKETCPSCNGKRGPVIARVQVVRRSPNGVWRYARFTHRTRLADGRLKRKYCYVPVKAKQNR